MDLDRLATACNAHLARGGAALTGLCYDSRRARPGYLFVALHGEKADGNAYVPDAIARGAVAIASEEPATASPAIPWLRVADARLFLALSARELLRKRPIPRLVAVTGTKGKTTTAHALCHILRETGHPCGLLGTVVYELGGRVLEAPRTTPEAPDIEAFLQEMAAAGMEYGVMEASSHAIAQKRVAAIPYAGAVFTNLGRDHLDFHGTEESYFAAKRRLFEGLSPEAFAVVNADDPRAESVAAATGGHVIRFGAREGADARIAALTESEAGIAFRIERLGSSVAVRSPLLGACNGHNLAAAFAASVALGVDPDRSAAALATFGGVPGRLAPVRCGQPFLCLVDYAHTPEALETALSACRALAGLSGRVIVVMGCGGDRDRGKRPLMGAAAVIGSDHCIVTSDNPRSEDPLTIILDVEVGIRKARENGSYRALPDRREAIRAAVTLARAGDVVLIAGKGHERTQTGRNGAIPFDDREVAREEIQRLATGSSAEEPARQNRKGGQS